MRLGIASARMPRGSISALAVIVFIGLGNRAAWADGCPLPTSEIDTDRPDTTNSSEVVPVGSLQVENGVNIADWPDGTRLDGTNSRLRLGVADTVPLGESIGHGKKQNDDGLLIVWIRLQHIEANAFRFRRLVKQTVSVSLLQRRRDRFLREFL